MPITWILFGIGINDYCEPFTLQFWENVFDPFCEKIGITSLY